MPLPEIVKLDLTARALEASLSSLAPHSRRVYKSRINAYLAWSGGTTLDRESVQRYLRSLETRGASAQVRNQTLAALKKFALEASELGWIEAAQALQIERIKSKKITGIRSGYWLNAKQAAALLASVDRTLQGERDLAALVLLLGCGLRRSELVSLKVSQFADRGDSGRTIIENLAGKGGRTRSVAVPGWAWALAHPWWMKVESGLLFRSIRPDGSINGSLSPAAVRDIVRHYGKAIGVPNLNPHDLRRTMAKLARLGSAPLETIQHTLGHASVKTTEVYVKTGEEANAGDFFTL